MIDFLPHDKLSDQAFVESLRQLFEDLNVPTEVREFLIDPDYEDINFDLVSGTFDVVLKYEYLYLIADHAYGDLSSEDRSRIIKNPFAKSNWKAVQIPGSQPGLVDIFAVVLSEPDSELDLSMPCLSTGAKLGVEERRRHREAQVDFLKEQRDKGVKAAVRILDFVRSAGENYWNHTPESLYLKLYAVAFEGLNWTEVREAYSKPVRQRIFASLLVLVQRQPEIKRLQESFENSPDQFLTDNFDLTKDQCKSFGELSVLPTPLALAVNFSTRNELENLAGDADGSFLLFSKKEEVSGKLIILHSHQNQSQDEFLRILDHEVTHSIFCSLFYDNAALGVLSLPDGFNAARQSMSVLESGQSGVSSVLTKIQDEVIAYASTGRPRPSFSAVGYAMDKILRAALFSNKIDKALDRSTEVLEPHERLMSIASDMKAIRKLTGTYRETVEILYEALAAGKLLIDESELLIRLLSTPAYKSKRVAALLDFVDPEYLEVDKQKRRGEKLDFSAGIEAIYYYDKLFRSMKDDRTQETLASDLSCFLNSLIGYLETCSSNQGISTLITSYVNDIMDPFVKRSRTGELPETVALEKRTEIDLGVGPIYALKVAMFSVWLDLDTDRMARIPMSLYLIQDTTYAERTIDALSVAAELFFPANDKELEDYLEARDILQSFLDDPPYEISEKAASLGSQVVQKMNAYLKLRESILAGES